MEYGIHWFRRDLRVVGNPALLENWKKNNGRVVGIFCFDKDFLSREDFSYNRFQFFLNCLKDLQKQLREIGSDLIFLDIGPEKSFSDLLSELKEKNKSLPSLFSWNEDFEPFAIKRDEKIRNLMHDFGVDVFEGIDHVLIRPLELTKNGDTQDGYKVYTPFSRKWLSLFETPKISKRVKLQKMSLDKFKKNGMEKVFKLTWKDIFKNDIQLKDSLDEYIQKNSKHVDVKIPEGGFNKALECLSSFEEKINDYGIKRDLPAISGTSKLSMFLKNGSITITQIIAHLDLSPYVKKETGRDIFFSELIWREFYYHLIARCPYVEKLEFLEKFRKLPWENNKKFFEAWRDGKTGFPIVDAGMRQLKETGWMHNRVRMIVASFLVKDLLVDWRWGEKYFMEKLLDGDLAPNNGGWQWAASTGCDAQPYFRIFNPWTQGKRFDAKGEYITRYIPELKNIEPKLLHKPILGHETYPEPIVDHSVQRKKALELFGTKKS